MFFYNDWPIYIYIYIYEMSVREEYIIREARDCWKGR